MRWVCIAFRQLWRRPLRTAVTAGGVALAVAASFGVLAFQSGYRRSLARELDQLGAHILVVPKGCPYDAASLALHGANWPCYLQAAYLDAVRRTPGVAAAAPVLMTAFFDATGGNIVYVGVDTNLLILRPALKVIGTFPTQPDEVMAGAEAARRWGWAPGQRVVLPGLRQVERQVSAVVAATGGADDRFIFLPLAAAQELFHHPAQLTHVLVRLDDPSHLERVVTALRGCEAGLQMNVVPLAHLFETIQSLVGSTRWFLGCVTLIGLLAAGAGVTASLLIAVTERTREIGVMRSLGASRGDVFRLIWIETLLTCLLGSVAGAGSAYLSLTALEAWLRTQLPFVPDTRILSWEWWIAGACVTVAVAVGSVAGLAPAWRAATLEPVEAFRAQGVGL